MAPRITMCFSLVGEAVEGRAECPVHVSFSSKAGRRQKADLLDCGKQLRSPIFPKDEDAVSGM